MEINSSFYPLFMLYSFVVGAALGAVYDVFRIVRIMAASKDSFRYAGKLRERFLKFIGRKNDAENSEVNQVQSNQSCDGRITKGILKKLAAAGNVVIFIQDILYSLTAAVCITVLVFHANSGRIRWFALAASAVGFFVYYFTLGRLVILFSEYIVCGIRYITVKFIKLLFFFIKLLISPFVWIFRKLCKAVYNAISVTILKNYTDRYTKRMCAFAAHGFRGKAPKIKQSGTASEKDAKEKHKSKRYSPENGV